MVRDNSFKGIPLSAFGNSAFVPVSDDGAVAVTKEQSLPMFTLPNGKQMVCANPTISGAALTTLQKAMGADLSFIKGVWTWTPLNSDD